MLKVVQCLIWFLLDTQEGKLKRKEGEKNVATSEFKNIENAGPGQLYIKNDVMQCIVGNVGMLSDIPVFSLPLEIT